ncbi:MAG: hypothetical protein KJO12_07005, partial [Ignavibacteria bacterium]|nr:hypothetical protein [Ignavibacteria bacterium]
MKTTLFFFGIFFICTISFSQTTAIPDANFEQALVNQGIDTNGLTGDILNTDAAAVTFLSVSFASISDLTGIEAFTALQFLYCDNNALTSLDLSSNTNLEILYCNVNSITSLNITNNTALTNLICGENFTLANLDVSQNPNLTDLG